MNSEFTGFWQGIYEAKCRVIKIRILEVPATPLHWQNPLAGTERQAIEIEFQGEHWLIDNEHGIGYTKVTAGMGSPQFPHSGVNNYDFLDLVPEEEWKKTPDWLAYKLEGIFCDAWREKADPVTYAKLQKVRQMIINNHKPYPEEDN